MNVTDEQIEILKQMQALGMTVSGSAIDDDPRIEADPNPLLEGQADE
jgi:hypothetical protein